MIRVYRGQRLGSFHRARRRLAAIVLRGILSRKVLRAGVPTIMQMTRQVLPAFRRGSHGRTGRGRLPNYTAQVMHERKACAEEHGQRDKGAEHTVCPKRSEHRICYSTGACKSFNPPVSAGVALFNFACSSQLKFP